MKYFPSLYDLAPDTMDELKEDSILQKNICATKRGDTESWLVGLKGYKPNKSK